MEFTELEALLAVPAWGYVVYLSVLVGVLFACGADYIENHMIAFYPEVGSDAITGKEEARIHEEKRTEELKKAA